MQADTAADGRDETGLHGAFNSVMPIVSYSGNVELQYVSYRLGKPAFDERECRVRGLTFAAPLRVLVRGTTFQVKVWEALMSLSPGELTSYEALARRVGNPRAVRAVASANAANAVAYLIPCHRVIRKSGALGGYRWGLGRKLALLSWEAARRQAVTS